MDIENKLINLHIHDAIAHNVILGFVAKYGSNYAVGKDYPYQSNPILRVIKEHREEIIFNLMLMYKKMLDENHRLILKILEESKTPIIIDKENFIKLPKKEGGK
jgi:hypothetical protein